MKRRNQALNTNKFISEFQEISTKIDTYESERNNLLNRVKELEKENKKYQEKINKTTDTLLKTLFKAKILSNQFFIDEINTIFSFNQNNKKKENKV